MLVSMAAARCDQLPRERAKIILSFRTQHLLCSGDAKSDFFLHIERTRLIHQPGAGELQPIKAEGNFNRRENRNFRFWNRPLDFLNDMLKACVGLGWVWAMSQMAIGNRQIGEADFGNRFLVSVHFKKMKAGGLVVEVGHANLQST